MNEDERAAIREEIDAIRAHHAGDHIPQPCTTPAMGYLPCDAAFLLSEIDRLMTAIATELVTVSIERARIRAAVERLPSEHEVDAGNTYNLTVHGYLDRDAVLAAIDGTA